MTSSLASEQMTSPLSLSMMMKVGIPCTPNFVLSFPYNETERKSYEYCDVHDVFFCVQGEQVWKMMSISNEWEMRPQGLSEGLDK